MRARAGRRWARTRWLPPGGDQGAEAPPHRAAVFGWVTWVR